MYTLASTVHIVPDGVFRAFLREFPAHAVFVVYSIIEGFGFKFTNESGAIEEFVAVALGVSLVGPARHEFGFSAVVLRCI